MVHRVAIRDNTKTPLYYLSDLKSFKNGTEYEFKPGVNVIIGENGCGKTTLMNLIGKYLLVGFNECEMGMYRCNINSLYSNVIDKKLSDGADVYADYDKNTFRLSHAGEKDSEDALETFEDFGLTYTQKYSSTGEGVLTSISSLFNYMFSNKAKLTFDYNQLKDSDPLYWEYIQSHKKEGNEYTILMDEPDRNLSINHINQIKTILSFHKEKTQIIAVIHNPLLIYSLSRNNDVNIIEMTKGYKNKVIKFIDNLVK